MSPALEDSTPSARQLAAAEACCHRLAGHLFPWDITRSLELALLRTFSLPSISGLLVQTGEFEQRPRKRYDDTGLMVAELLRHGVNSAAGMAVIERMNRIHGHYAISNDDFLYVLSTFVAEPIRWIARYGWRALSPEEQQHLFVFWQAVGERMGLHHLPASLEALLSLNRRVEHETFPYAESNRRVADATLTMLLSDWPSGLRPLLRTTLLGLLDAPLCDSLGWSRPPTGVEQLVLLALRTRSRSSGMSQWLRQRLGQGERSRFYSQSPTPSYGSSFRLEQLGPPALLDKLNRP
ncbi:MAG: oxygenase MpaB family protein [Cyanobacteriota bacterium]